MLTFRCWYGVIAIILIPFTLQAQKRNNIWFFGARAGIDFNGPAPVSIPGGLAASFEGSAVMAERNSGALLFYTDGEKAMNRNRVAMPGGLGLNGNNSSTQSSLIVPMPGDSMKYYLFTTDAIEHDLANGLQYSIVDMRLDGGLGDIARKNVPLVAPVAEKLTGMLGCDGRYYWVIVHEWGNNAFRAYRITPNGISSPVISAVGIGHKAFQTNAVGYMKLSPNGRKLAVAITGENIVQLFDFDTQTGAIANPIDLPFPDTTFTYGAEFSPNSSLLYLSGFKNVIYQYNITSNDPVAIGDSRFLLNSPTTNTSFGALQLGPDGRIYYVTTGKSSLGVIENPNVQGIGATFRPSGFDLGTASGSLGLPNMITGDAHDLLNVQVDSARAICPGGSAQLHASGGTFYQWSPATGLSCADCPSPTASPIVTTTYTVSIYNDADCPTVDSVTVMVHQPPGIDAGRDVAICRGDSATLTVTVGALYQWSPATGLSCTDCRSPRAMPATTTLYHVVVTDSGGCTATDSVLVTALPPFTADAGPDTTLCRGAAIPLHASSGTAWRWTPAATLSCADCPDPVASPSATTTYHVVITSPEGCVATDSIIVTVTSLPLVDAGNDAVICAGEDIQLRASDGAAWIWSPAAGLSCANCRSPIASPVTTTTYHLLVTGVNGCIGEDSVTVMVKPLPIADAGRDTMICAGSSIALHAGIARISHWSPAAGLSCADCSDPLASPNETTTYILTVTSEGGCSAIDSVTVNVIIPPPIDAGPDTIICAEGSVVLHASGGSGYHWSPAAGLSCTDCPDPIATPSLTTLYTVSVPTATGCPAIDSVRIAVLPRGTIHAHIPRDLHLLPGTSINVPIIVDDPATITAGNVYTIRLAYRPGIIRIGNAITDRTASEGWRLDSRIDTTGEVTIRMTRPAGITASTGDTLLMFELRAFVGDSIASELPFALEPGCASVQTTPGLLTLDSICGLSQRLIEPITGDYALRQNFPNPFSPSTSMEFSLGLDGPTRLTVVDEGGRTVARLLEGEMPAGTYSIVWDASAIPSGLYYCRLSSGDWSATRVMMLVR